MIHFKNAALTDTAVVSSVGFRVVAFLAVPGTAVVFDCEVGLVGGVCGGVVLGEVGIAIVLREVSCGNRRMWEEELGSGKWEGFDK